MSSIASSPPPGAAVPGRIASIDLLRGAAMVWMAIDHVRVYSGVPAGGPELGVFFTRWITHFCAPAFFFLAGTSAYFYGLRHADLSRFLVTRGLWLVLLEATFLRVAWTFNFGLGEYQMAGVIWALGVCMVLLAVLVKLPLPWVAAFGIAVVAGHNLADPHFRGLVEGAGQGLAGGLARILYLGFFAGPVQLGSTGPELLVLYSIVPWIGVMAAGYAFGRVFTLEPRRRDRICLAVGLGAVALFLVLRGFNLYGDPRPWAASPPMPGWLSFLNATKYPASLAFLLMTLGPALALVPWLERARGAWTRGLAVFGRVPFFFYLLHIPLIHALALAVSALRRGAVDPWLFANHPLAAPPAPDGYAWGLPLLYLVWAAATVLLYVACRWFADLKARRREAWLRFL